MYDVTELFDNYIIIKIINAKFIVILLDNWLQNIPVHPCLLFSYEIFEQNLKNDETGKISSRHKLLYD